MGHFSAEPQINLNSTTPSRQHHIVSHYFLSDYRKHDAFTNTAQSKDLISLLIYKKLLTRSLSTIWENTDGSAEQYIFASEINLMSVMSHFYYIIID